MASVAAKAKRRAEALNELDRLSNLLADKTGVEIPNLRPQNRDPELKSIERVEAINGLLRGVLGSMGVEVSEAEEAALEVIGAQEAGVAGEVQADAPKVNDRPAKKASKKSSKKGRK